MKVRGRDGRKNVWVGGRLADKGVTSDAEVSYLFYAATTTREPAPSPEEPPTNPSPISTTNIISDPHHLQPCYHERGHFVQNATMSEGILSKMLP